MGYALEKIDVPPARWGRLLSEEDAAEYLSISRTTLRDLEIAARRIGRRVLYDRLDLDRFVDRMANAAAPAAAASVAPDAATIASEEAAFFERRRRRGTN